MSAMFSEVWKGTIGKAMVMSQFVSQTARLAFRVSRRERIGSSKAGIKMSTNHRTRFGWLGVAMLAGLAFVAPVAQATPVTYDFTIVFQPFPAYGPLAGTTETGTFTFDSSSIVPSGGNSGPGLLTSLDFTHNGIHYDETTANTGYLSFDSVGNLLGFGFGNDCPSGNCTFIVGTNDWMAGFGGQNFWYTAPGFDTAWPGELSYAFVPYVPPSPTGVAEPGALGTMAFGLGLLAILYRRRRLS